MRNEGEHEKAQDQKTVIGMNKKIVLLVASQTIGRGDDELGGIIMGSFLHTMKEIEPVPWRIIFMNGGVKLATEESLYIDLLNEIRSRNTEILVCGACLDFFNLKEKLRVGRMCNMFEILSSCSEATSVIRP